MTLRSCITGIALLSACGQLEIGSYGTSFAADAGFAGGSAGFGATAGQQAFGSAGSPPFPDARAGSGNEGPADAGGGGNAGAGGGCGDGETTGLEECDGAGETYDCNADCTWALCGDGKTNRERNEECDDGVTTESCDANCTFAYCGDATVNRLRGEFCDRAGVDAYDCDSDCSEVVCGDGHINTKLETCDDGNQEDMDACPSVCHPP